jgi:hypothetical protein
LTPPETVFTSSSSDNGKLSEPVEAIKRLKIVRVPTVIVERDGVEIGRIVENPTAKTMEEDLAAILNGTRNTDKHE